ncbi:SPOR domain-containing protein [Treponema sp. OttesenSCG-928-L16]|nr:SPOR domain-containing protein [Treponema sp. OttesenSCG-928-L16]
MGLIRKHFVLVSLLLIPLLSGFGQDADSGPVLFSAEMQEIETSLQDTSVSPEKRKETLLRLGRLLQLAGNTEQAARIWTEAAYTEKDKRDDPALLNAAACLIAMGELDAADEHIRTVLLGGRDAEVFRRARYLGAQSAALRSENRDSTVLAAFIDDPGFSAQVPEILYLLWKSSGEAAYRNRLLSDYPASPEALIAAEGDASRVSAAPSPLWLLMPGRESFRIDRAQGLASAPSETASSQNAAGQSGAAASSSSPSAAAVSGQPSSAAPSSSVQGSSEGGASALQTGLFGREENARAMADRLKNAGFSPSILRKSVNGNNYWAVTVPPGNDANYTMMRLKNAGFESFPVF